MPRTDLLNGVGVFIIVVAAVLAGTAGIGLLGSDAGGSATAADAPAYETDGLVATPVDSNGAVAPPNGTGSATVVIDRSHGNAIDTGDLRPLRTALVEAGHEVLVYRGGGSQSFGGSGGSTLNATLRQADAFVVANPNRGYTDSEVAGLKTFTEAGGRLLILNDPGQSPQGTQSQLPNPLGGSSSAATAQGQPTNVAGVHGFAFGAGYLYNTSRNANNFQSVYASPATDTGLTTGVDRLIVHDASALDVSPSGQVLATADETRLSTTRQLDSYPVVARHGEVVAVGDTNLLSPSGAELADNGQFVSNLATFLVSGDKTPGAPASAQSTAARPPGAPPSLGGGSAPSSTPASNASDGG